MRNSIKMIVIGGFAGLALAGCKQETNVPAAEATATEVVAVPGESTTTVVPVPGATSTETVVVPVPGATVTETATPAPSPT